jgi:serine/threonine-protein kinase
VTLDGPRTKDADAVEEPAAVDLRAVGDRLGRYQLVMPLAQGGMGLVFAGRLVGAHGVERLVAIKTLRPITSANDRAALLREARLTSQLHHRNVVATLDLGEVDAIPYVVMELVDGVSLARLLRATETSKRLITPELAAWIVMQSSLGLHAAHELADPDGRPLDLVHRDVSPQNILLSMSGEVKLADFGIAKFAGRDESTATGTIKGKFGYMSPEQASAGTIDRRSDVFALGVVLWEALVGERLFLGDSPARTILRVMEHTPASPMTRRPEVGPELSAIVLKCLAKNRDERYPTAAALADAIRSALRARGTAVDEGDLSTTVTGLFGEERRSTMDRLRSEITAKDATAGTLSEDAVTPLLVAPPDQSAIAVSLSTPTPRRGAPWIAIGSAIATVLLGGGGWLALHRGNPPSPPLAPSAPAVAPTPSVAASAPPAPPVASSVAMPTPAPPAPLPAAATAKRTAKPAAKPTPAPAKSAGAQPFESL